MLGICDSTRSCQRECITLRGSGFFERDSSRRVELSSFMKPGEKGEIVSLLTFISSFGLRFASEEAVRDSACLVLELRLFCDQVCFMPLEEPTWPP